MEERRNKGIWKCYHIVMGLLLFTGLVLFSGGQVMAGSLEENGALAVSGTKLVSRKTGKEVVLRGVSTHGINWDVGYPYITKAAFQTLRDDYGVNAIRLAMYTTEYYGYCDKGSASESQSMVQKTLKERIHAGVSAATELDMYVIIDWHILNDKNPNQYKKQAKAFFEEMSKKYAGQDNVLYEICNEPNGGTSWSDITSYAKTIIPVIRANDEDAVIIVGTPNWSQDVDVAAKAPLPYDNIMYTLHFYAATHKDSYREKLKTALADGLPVMVTEFGVSEASGAGSINTAEAKKWLDLLDANGISYFAWSLSNKEESSALLKAGTGKKSGWKTSDLSAAGKWVLGQYQKRGKSKTASGSSVSLAKPSIKVKGLKGKKVRVTYKKINGASGYQILYAANNKFTNAKKKTTKKNSYTLTKLKKGKTYYIKVCAYKKWNGKTYYSTYSVTKKIKIKK